MLVQTGARAGAEAEAEARAIIAGADPHRLNLTRVFGVWLLARE